MKQPYFRSSHICFASEIFFQNIVFIANSKKLTQNKAKIEVGKGGKVGINFKIMQKKPK